jgi:hypothetical protein
MKPVGVAAEDVTGDVESVGGERRLDVRPIVIAVHECRAFHFQHALLRVAVVAVDQPQLDLRMRIADRHVRLREAAGMGAEHDRTGLGRTVGVGNRHVWQCPADRFHEALTDRC